MGLESVELVMAMEEEFQIEIPDAEAAKTVTVGDMVDLVERNLTKQQHILNGPEDPDSERAAHFSKVANALGQSSDLARGARLSDLLPLKKRPDRWSEIESELGKFTPDLSRPILVTIMIWIGAAVSGYFVGQYHLSSGISVFLVALVVGLIATRRLKLIFPKEVQTFEQLAEFLHRKTPGKILERVQQSGFSREVIKREVVEILVEQLGVTHGDCTEEARFVQDLGVD